MRYMFQFKEYSIRQKYNINVRTYQLKKKEVMQYVTSWIVKFIKNCAI